MIMCPSLTRATIIFAAMAASFGITYCLGLIDKTTTVTAHALNLGSMIPETFDGWTIDRSITPILPSPDLQAVVDQTYDQTLSRTYVNTDQQRVMLMIAYAGNFSGRPMQYHRPDVCYPAQGFDLLAKSRGTIATSYGPIPVERISTKNGSRYEPVTYWITVAEQRTSYGLSLRWVQFKSSLTGQVPDGMLVRFSSIDQDAESAYRKHDEFAAALLTAMKPVDAARIAGAMDDRN
jgi:EpsI family protein